MRFAVVASVISLGALVAACGGGSSMSGGPLSSMPSTSAPAASAVNISAGEPAALPPSSNGYSGTIVVPQPDSGATTGMTALLQDTLPPDVPAPQSVARAPGRIDLALALVYVVLHASEGASFGSYPAFTFSLPRGTTIPPGSSAFIAFYDPLQGTWVTIGGPGSAQSQSISFPAFFASVTLKAGTRYLFVLFIARPPTPTATPTLTPTPTSTPSPSPTRSPTPSPSPSATPTTGNFIIR
jgi:hypothetical protein